VIEILNKNLARIIPNFDSSDKTPEITKFGDTNMVYIDLQDLDKFKDFPSKSLVCPY
jgi:hypothetical protein